MKKTGQILWDRAKKMIPGGNQLLSKRAEMFLPDEWPSYFSRAKGPYIWDLDGNKYLDMSIMGIGACPLGYADREVDAAVKRSISRGSMATWNTPDEIDLAEMLLDIHPWAGMVRYARTGGESMAIAVRIARAFTGKEVVAFCGYHGWSDWYLATNINDEDGLTGHLLSGLQPRGVPNGLRGTVVPFRYNRLEELASIADRHDGKLAAVVMEPIHGDPPAPGFLEGVRAITKKHGAVLIFDEISIGFKENLGGAHLLYGINPDIAVFSKGISNGYPMAAVIGAPEVMQAAQDTFISSTYWTESIGPAAAIATIKKMRDFNVQSHLRSIGGRAKDILECAARRYDINLSCNGPLSMSFFSFNYGASSNAVRTLFTQEMLDRGILAANRFYPSFAHRDDHLDGYDKAVNEVFLIIQQALEQGTVLSRLRGPVAHSGFQRLN